MGASNSWNQVQVTMDHSEILTLQVTNLQKNLMFVCVYMSHIFE